MTGFEGQPPGHRVTLSGGPMGQREWGRRGEYAPGDRIVVRRDPHGAPMKPVLYVVLDTEDPRRPGNLIARHSGFATEADLA